MRQTQTGFTLIELLIVVTIIGVLAAIAVPTYQEYALRTKITEGASLSGAARTAVDIAYAEGYSLTGGIPSQTSLGLSSPGSYSAKYVSSVATDSNGVITVTLSNDSKLGIAASGTLTYTPVDEGRNLSWTVDCPAFPRLCPRD